MHLVEYFQSGFKLLMSIVALLAAASVTSASSIIASGNSSEDRPVNVIFILSDDHRYDMMSFHDNAPDWLDTPSMDRMAHEGLHISNAFVTTSLCSPSRASILTGQYAHTHRIVDNQSAIPEGTKFFNEDLQKNGYQTGYFGKWHMGDVSDNPMPGWDRWVSFRGQGQYYNPLLNIDGERQQFEGYTTDILTDEALRWLDSIKEDREPFFLYLSHKAVHAEFEPAERHQGVYSDVKIPYPASMDYTERNYRTKPSWVKHQRQSWHGVDYPYHGEMDFDEFYKRYAETLLALDESVGDVLNYLDDNGLADNTLVIYMGDNGFLLGEHGLIDKRNAYEESIRVPMLAWAPGWIEAGQTTDFLVRNIDIAPSFLELANSPTDISMDGQSFIDVLTGGAPDENREFLYEYYWEPAFPQTPTTFALRTDDYKYIYYHGIWDRDELYDMREDPNERYNLSEVPQYRQIRNQMRTRLFEKMEETGAMQIPLRRPTFSRDEKLIRN